MSLNPVNELKRHLDDHDIPLPKRLCLAKNVIQSYHLPSAPKERIVATWLETLTQRNELSGEDLKSVIGWVNIADDLTNDLKGKLIQIISQYLKRNPLQSGDLPCMISFLENSKLLTQLSLNIAESLHICVTLLQYLKRDESSDSQLAHKLLNIIVKFYKESKKKLEFIINFLDGENLETVLSYLDTDYVTVKYVCENILFPMNKKSFFANYLQTLVRKDNLDDLISEKGDNIRAVLKIMDTFFNFPQGRNDVEHKFLSDFIEVFVSCYRTESQLIFAFYVMIANCLNMEQNYLTPAMNMKPITFPENDEKIIRSLFLSMLNTLLNNEIDTSVRLSDTLGVKIPRVETKKTFLLFLETVMMGQLKMEGKADKTTFNIVKSALKLDPSLVEPKTDDILPPLMCVKKTTNSIESYTQMLNFTLETYFKLGRGTLFVNNILPLVKNCLSANNNEDAQVCEKNKKKTLSANEIFPEETVELYGRLTSELMFRQNKDLLVSLQKGFEELSLNALCEGQRNPPTVILTEVMSAILSTFFKHCKMADHTVPLQIAEEFWSSYNEFECNCLKKFGESIIKTEMDCEPQLLRAFLKLCCNFSYLRLLKVKYSNTKLEISEIDNTSGVFDVSVLLPSLKTEQWTQLASKITDDEATLLMDEILLIKTMVIKVLTSGNSESNEAAISETKSYLIKQLNNYPGVLKSNNHIPNVLLSDLDKSQIKQVAKVVIEQFLIDSDENILKTDAVINNRPLLSALLLETIKNILKCFNNSELLTKAVAKSNFDFISFAKDIDMKDFFKDLTFNEDADVNNVPCHVELLKHLQIYYLEETHQLIAIFVLLAIKKNAQKKLRRNIDRILLSIFELCSQPPDLYKIFPVQFIFSFKDRLLIDLLCLKIETSNSFLPIKCLLESAVKRVKIEKDLVLSIAELLLRKQSKVNMTSIEFFNEPAFQMSCIILPLIVRQKKVITLSAYRSILADLQEKLHKSLLECFKNINFKEYSSMLIDETGNTDESTVVSDSTTATLNAISAYSLTLSKYSESTDSEELKNLDCLWSGLEYFVQNAVISIQNSETKHQHVESSIQLLNTVLRYIKKLATHEIFQTKDKLFIQIWNSVKARLSMILDERHKKKYMMNASLLEDISVTIKFLCEWISVEGFVGHFVADLNTLSSLQPPKIFKNETQSHSPLTSHIVAKYLWTQILKANIVGQKCVALSKLMYQNSRNLKSYVHEHFESEHTGVIIKSKKKKLSVEIQDENGEDKEIRIVLVDDVVCEMVKTCLGSLSEAILAAKKINLDYKFLDVIFEVQNSVHYILGHNTIGAKCEISWQAFFKLFEGLIAVLNSLLVSREELLEDRWPCYMQCYRMLTYCLCSKSSSQAQLERSIEDKLGELAHSVEKLTQSICKRKSHVSRIAAYSVGDLCSVLEKTVPSRNVRQHIENSIALLIQASDTVHAMAFLRRALAGSAGQMTMTNMYTMYKRYHKYVGNA
ncbi:unnamed protein product [Chilo suppressalis]|uniref:Nucleolar 27S pre-rRNA processing Urb2/Npa2 C-terminal domain-containing protein n=1 Tax=Chilo suppressalis TaxID=168631 RepID=A0ABN8LA11_CHISP|nr:unnamed protein product [Chilo suppressalis]